MNYSIIGTGNMAAFLLKRLGQCGHTCSGIWGRSHSAARNLATAWGVPQYPTLRSVYDGPDVCFLAVSDDAIAGIAESLQFRSTVLVHLSGTADIRNLTKDNLHCGVLWPVYSIQKNDLPEHNNFPVIWEGNSPEARRVVAALAAEIGNYGYEAGTEQRRALHLAAVFANNFSNYLIGISQDVCAGSGLPATLIGPILQQTFDRSQRGAAKAVQTGPARRGDFITMEAHRLMLAHHPDWLAVYNVLSAGIATQIPSVQE